MRWLRHYSNSFGLAIVQEVYCIVCLACCVTGANRFEWPLYCVIFFILSLACCVTMSIRLEGPLYTKCIAPLYGLFTLSIKCVTFVASWLALSSSVFTASLYGFLRAAIVYTSNASVHDHMSGSMALFDNLSRALEATQRGKIRSRGSVQQAQGPRLMIVTD